MHDQLAARGFHLFMPTVTSWSHRRGAQHLISLPMFAGYLFLRHAMDKTSHGEIRKARGLIKVLGTRWDRLEPVPDAQIDGLRTLLATGLPVMSHAFPHEGQRVRVTRGPLVDVTGVLVRTDAGKGRLVISVDLLQRSVAVMVNASDVAPS